MLFRSRRCRLCVTRKLTVNGARLHLQFGRKPQNLIEKMYEQTSINFSYEALLPQLRVAEVIAQPLLKERLLLSVSGGLTSMLMMLYCLKKLSDKYEMICVFANTGKEKEGTLKFVNDCAIRFKTMIIWVEAKHRDENGNPYSRKGWKVKHKVVNFETASQIGRAHV